MASPAAPAPIAEGRVLGGRYRLVRRIARGGMAEVWEGHDEVLARPVAVKILHPHLAADEVFRERFRREAITAARLAHPGVVATYDTGIDAETAYIVMELVRGQTLRQLLAQRGRLELPLAIGLTRQIADALAYAHRAGLIHRDVKPANVLLTDDDGGTLRAKVTDFGIAKASEGLEQDLTNTGMVLGTPKYLSPEQIRGTEPDARADLYSLGVILYEMVAGRPPFVGKTDMATAMAHLNDQPVPLRQYRPDAPLALERIVADLLAKEPTRRVPTAAALSQALARIGPVSPAANGVSGRHPGPTNGIAGPVGASRLTPPNPVPSVPRSRGSGPAPGSDRTRTNRLPPVSSGPPGPAYPGYGPPSGPPRPPHPPARRGRRRPRLGVGIVVACLALTALILVGVLLVESQGSGSKATGSTGSTANGGSGGTPIRIQDVTVFMANSRPPDNPGETHLAFDGNPATAWMTAVYRSPTFGNLYPGIGLAIDLGSSHTLHRLSVTSSTHGWAAQTYTSVDTVTSGQAVNAWGSPSATQTDVAGNATFDLGGRHGRYVLLWLTNLGPADIASVNELLVS